MINKISETYIVKIYSSGPIHEAERLLRKYAMDIPICITISPTKFIYVGGEEVGFEVGLVNYPRFPKLKEELWEKAIDMANLLLQGLYQNSILVMSLDKTLWISKREDIDD